MSARLPCQRCAGTGWDGHADRKIEKIEDSYRACVGTRQAHSSLPRGNDASCHPDHERDEQIPDARVQDRNHAPSRQTVRVIRHAYRHGDEQEVAEDGKGDRDGISRDADELSHIHAAPLDEFRAAAQPSRVIFADVLGNAQRYRGGKRRAPASGERVAV